MPRYVSNMKRNAFFSFCNQLCSVKLNENRLQNCFVQLRLLQNRWLGWSVTRVVTQCVRFVGKVIAWPPEQRLQRRRRFFTIRDIFPSWLAICVQKLLLPKENSWRKALGKKTEKENKPFHGFRRVSSQKYFESYGLCICCILDSHFLVVKKIALTADVVNVFHSTGLWPISFRLVSGQALTYTKANCLHTMFYKYVT